MELETRSVYPPPQDVPKGDFISLLFFTCSSFDWFFSTIAFRLGVEEGNPVLNWFLRFSLFTPAKLAMTILASLLILVVYRHRAGRAVSCSGALLMGLINTYHIVGLGRILDFFP